MTDVSKNGKNSGQAGNQKLVQDTVVRKEDTSIIVARIARTGAIVGGSITLIGVIIVALLNFPPVIRYFESAATLTNTPSPTVSFTPTILPSVTHNMTLTPPPVPNSETPFTVSPSPTAPLNKMIIVLHANMTSGKAPLSVNFNASDSFMELADGSTWACSQAHLCTYTWTVNRANKQVGKPVKGSGKFSYTFSVKGTYFITAYVCRGAICNAGGITVVIK